MKHSVARWMSVFLLVIILFTGCGSYEITPEESTYFHIEYNRPFQTKVTLEPQLTCNFSDQYAVIPYDTYHANSASSAKLCINNSTNEMVDAANPFERIYPASITKIMTALLVLEKGNLSDTVTVTEEIELNDPMAVTFGLQVGDTITVNELMHAMLIASSNDCAVVLARYISGNENLFVDEMNRRAGELGATHTHFVNSNGLHAEDHYTTAYDLYLIFRELITHDEFLQITGLSEYTVHYTNAEGTEMDVPIVNSNLFISNGYPIAEGITVVAGKTGTTNEAGSCLIVEAKDADNQNYIAVICGAASRDSLYYQMQQLLNEILTDEAEGNS